MSPLRRGLLELTVALLCVGWMPGQTLRARGATVTPELKKVYESPDYEGFYQAAENTYNNATPEQAFTPTVWDPRKPLVWLLQSQRQIVAYTRDLQTLKRELDRVSKEFRVGSDVERVAQTSQIEDRLTKEDLETLDALIGSVDLGTLFTSNHKPSEAKVWSPRRVPASVHMLDENKLEEVVAALDDVNLCLSRSAELHMQYARSASFSWNVPKDENDKPLTRQQAEVFWQAYTHPPLDKALAALYESLGKAEAAAKSEGLVPGDATLTEVNRVP